MISVKDIPQNRHGEHFVRTLLSSSPKKINFDDLKLEEEKFIEQWFLGYFDQAGHRHQGVWTWDMVRNASAN